MALRGLTAAASAAATTSGGDADAAVPGPAAKFHAAALPSMTVYLASVVRRLLHTSADAASHATVVCEVANAARAAAGTAIEPILQRLQRFATRAFGRLANAAAGVAPGDDSNVDAVVKAMKSGLGDGAVATAEGLHIADPQRRARVGLRLTRALQDVSVADFAHGSGKRAGAFTAVCLFCATALHDVSPVAAWLSGPGAASMYALPSVWTVVSAGERADDDVGAALVPGKRVVPAPLLAFAQSNPARVVAAIRDVVSRCTFEDLLAHACAKVGSRRVCCVAWAWAA